MNISRTIESLERRADYLARRVAESPKELSHDKRELAALRHAIEVLERERQKELALARPGIRA